MRSITSANGAAAALVDRLVERRHGERLPQQLDQPRRLAHARSQSRTVSSAAARGGAPSASRQPSATRAPATAADRRADAAATAGRGTRAASDAVAVDYVERQRGCIRTPAPILSVEELEGFV
jgi:hypothetical protein